MKLPSPPTKLFELLRRGARGVGDDRDGGREMSRTYYCYANPNEFGCNPAYIAAAVMSALLVVTALLGVIIFLCVRHANAKRMLRVQAQLGAHERAIFTVQQQQQQQQQHHQRGVYPMSLMFQPEPPPYNCEDYTLPPDSPLGADLPPPYEERQQQQQQQLSSGPSSIASMLYSRLFSGRQTRPPSSVRRSISATSAAQQQAAAAECNPSTAPAATGGGATAAANVVQVSGSATSMESNKRLPSRIGFVRHGAGGRGGEDDLPPVS